MKTDLTRYAMKTPTLVVAAVFSCLSGEAFAAPTDGQPSAEFAVAGLFAPDSPLPIPGASKAPAPPTVLETQQSTTPLPKSTGFRSLLKDSGRDFLAFPKRKSTWVFLGIGGAAAALAHPADPHVNAHLNGKWFVAGKYIGSAYVQVGVALGLLCNRPVRRAHRRGWSEDQQGFAPWI